MKLPSAIQAYFLADTSNNADALVRTFAPDAVVKDEGHAYSGHKDIDAWWRETKAKYQTTIEPSDVSEQDGITKVRALVSGKFEGSPATLTFAFRLKGEQIVRLEIGA